MLVYSFGGAMIFRALMCLAPVAALALGALIICAFALASASLVKQAAVHKYAPPGTSANASSFFHVALNIGGVLAGLLIDLTKGPFVGPATAVFVVKTLSLPFIGVVSMTNAEPPDGWEADRERTANGRGAAAESADSADRRDQRVGPGARPGALTCCGRRLGSGSTRRRPPGCLRRRRRRWPPAHRRS